MILLPRVVFLWICILYGVNGLMHADWFPDDMETCLRDRCSGVSSDEIPAFSIQYTCINYHLSHQNIDKNMIKGITEDNKNWYKSVGRMLNRLIHDNKRKKRQARFENRQRKEIRTFSDEELKAYFKAVNDIKKDGKYDAISNIHQHTAIPAGHFGPGFLGFHRVLLLIYQLAIWEKNSKVIIPICDTRLDHNMPGNPVATRLFTSKYFGNLNGQTVTGPFARWKTPARVVLQRNGGIAGSLMTHDGYKRVMQHKYTRDIIMSTSLANLELQHNNAHVWVGGLMSDLTYSPCDPFFFCHHAYIDYVWQKFRENQYNHGVQAWQDYPSNSDMYHQPNRNMDMISPYLGINITQADGYGSLFEHPSIVTWDDSHIEYPTCGKYADIAVNSSTGLCYSKSASPTEAINVQMQRRMRGVSLGPAFVAKNAFKVTKNDKRNEKKISKRSTRNKSPDNTESMYTSPMDLAYQNDFLMNGVIDEKKWGFIPCRVVYKRVPDTHFTIDTAKLQRVMEERAEHKPEETLSGDDDDLFSAHSYPRLWRKLKGGHPAKFGKSEIQDSGAYKIMVEATGFSYTGRYTDYAIVDERQPVSETVVYVGIKRPCGGEVVKSFVTAYDPNGRICEARCLVRGSKPAKYERCSGVVNIDNKSPKMYGDNLGDAYLLRYNFQGDDLPSSHDGDIFLMFYCSYGKNFPWENTYRKK